MDVVGCELLGFCLSYSFCSSSPQIKRSSGKIVVNASAAGWLPVPRMSFYNVIKHFIQSRPTVLAIFLMAFYSLDYFHQASKAALISFYETLRIEFGSDVKITIATPGVVGLNRRCPKGNFCPKKARCW